MIDLPPPGTIAETQGAETRERLVAPATPALAAAAPASPRSVTLTAALGDTLIQLGLTPVTAVVPALATALDVSTADGAWLLTSFILALAGSLLVAGRLGDLLGHRRLFALGALLYAAAAALAALAPTFELVVLARVAQGVGAAMVSGNNLAILTNAVPPAQRGRAIAAVATASSLSAIVGASLGTLVVAAGHWRLLFLATVPLAIWAALRARGLPAAPARASRGGIDWLGALLLAAAITLLSVALNHPHTTASDATMPVFHLWLPALMILSTVALVIHERRVRVPLLDWAQLRNRAFGAAVGVNGVLHMTMMAAMFLGPLYVVRGLGLDTTAGGMLLVVIQISVVLTAFIGGWWYDRTRAAWIRPAAAAVIALGLAAWSAAGFFGSYAGLIAAGLFAGLGNGVLLAVNNAVIMGSLPAGARGVAGGMLETTRHFGHAFGVTIPTAILALAIAATPDGGGAGVRLAFVVSCLLMAAVAALGALLAAVPAIYVEPEGRRA
jgi:MFS family permease